MMRQICYYLFITVSLMGSTLAYSNSETSDDNALFVQAVTMSTNGNWSEAEKIFRTVASRNPQWPEPKNNLAVALYNMGKLELARQALDEAVVSLPNFKVAQTNRQQLYDYAAATAYNNAVDAPTKLNLPDLMLLTEIQQLSNASKEQTPEVDPEKEQANIIKQQEKRAQEIKKSISAWSKSWLAGDAEGYIASYSTEFKPAAPGKKLSQWLEERTSKLKFGRVDRLDVESIEVYLDTNRKLALAQFIQHYQSRKYKDKVIKQLQLGLEEGHWRIRSERVLQQLN